MSSPYSATVTLGPHVVESIFRKYSEAALGGNGAACGEWAVPGDRLISRFLY